MPAESPPDPARGAPASDFALAERSAPLDRLLREEIARDGPLTFVRFMSRALTHPEHGYYSRPDLRWGRDGDYETSPEVHPIFGYLWARQVLECWERLDRPDPFHLVELGGGSGAFAVSLLGWLRERAPECFAATRAIVLDGHPNRVAAQRAALEAAGLEADCGLIEDWLDGTPAAALEGVVISNEFYDALPVHLVEVRDGRLHEWFVADEDGELRLELGEASTPALDARFEGLGLLPGDGARAEVSLALPEIARRVASKVARGYQLTIDYGYPAAELYAPWRRMGTLMAFRDHSPQPNPLAHSGRTDLTAHVDLTTLAAAGTAEGFVAAPPTSQAEALIALGIGEHLEGARAAASADVAAFARARGAIDTLLEPAGLGRIRVLAQAKDAPLEGLRCLQRLASPRLESPRGDRAPAGPTEAVGE